MRVRSCVFFALIALVSAPLQAGPVLITDNFNDNALNPRLWSPGVFGDGSVAEVNQRLEFSVASEGAGFVRLRGTVSGDFDLRFDYNLLSDFDALDPDENEPAVGVLWFFPDPGDDFFIRTAGCIAAQLNNTNAGEGCYLMTTEQAGTLRLTRIGDVYSAYHANGSGWDLLASGSSPLTGPADIWLAGAVSNGAGISAAIDNFSLQANGFAAEVPEPGSLALAGVALGLLLAASRCLRHAR